MQLPSTIQITKYELDFLAGNTTAYFYKFYNILNNLQLHEKSL